MLTKNVAVGMTEDEDAFKRIGRTLVHPITEESPFKFTKDDFANTQGEILVL
jgi:hypothetical protein